jgi:5-methylcytosine-specific restriction protein A
MARADYNNWYRTSRWRKVRARHLKKQPYCQCPHHIGQMVEGNTVDHITPHKGDTRLFWDERNFQTLTATCHSKFKQSEERGGRGFNQGCDAQGNPLNQLDHWK